MFCTVRGFVTLAMSSLTFQSKFRPWCHSEVAEIGQLRALIKGLAAQPAVAFHLSSGHYPQKSAAVIIPVWTSPLFPASFIKYPRSALFPSDWAVADVAELSAVYEMVRGIPENVPLAHSSHRCNLPPAASSLLMAICFTLDSLLPLCLSNKTLWQWQTFAAGVLGNGPSLEFRSAFSLPVI